MQSFLNFIYSEKATKFGKISTLDLTVLHTVKSKVEISKEILKFSAKKAIYQKKHSSVSARKLKCPSSARLGS